MAVEFGMILPLLLVPFLASTSLGQNLSEVTTNSSKIFSEIPDSPHENFNVSFYKKAQKYTEAHWREMTVVDANKFSQYSLYMENGIRQKMAEFAGNPSLSFEEMTKLIQKKIDEGEITSAEISTLQQHTLATQEAYVKRVIDIFDLGPDDLDTTPKYFCDVFEICKFLTTPTPSTTSEVSTVENTPKITIINTKSSSTTEELTTVEIKIESTPPVTESNIDTVNHESSFTTPVEPVPSKGLTPAAPEKTMDKETIDVTEKIENPPASTSEKTLTKVSERRSDEGLLKIEETLTGDKISIIEKSDAVAPSIVGSAEKTEPEAKSVKTKPETGTEKGWGSGSSRTSQFASTMLLCSLILTLSNFL